MTIFFDFSRGLSRRALEALGEPFGDSCTRVEGGRLILGGGGSGGGGGSSNPDTRYANLDRLYGIQSNASQFMLDQAMPRVTNALTNTEGMVNDAMDGTLATQMREQAGNDATASTGATLAASDRALQRYGVGFSADRMLSEGRTNAIQAAASKAGAMSDATAKAEETKWNRNAGLFAQATGMNSGAMQGMSSATQGMNQTNFTQQQNAQANAAGYGKAGSAFASGLMAADGGAIIDGQAVRLSEGGRACRRVLRLASGGSTTGKAQWEAYKAANPVTVSSGSGSSGGGAGSAFGQMLGGAAPLLLGHGIRDLLNLDGKGGKLVKAGKKAVDLIKEYQNAKQIAEVQQAMDASTSATAAADAGASVGAAADVASGADYMFGGMESSAAAMDAATSATAAADVAAAMDAATSATAAADAGASVGAAADVASGADYMGTAASSFGDTAGAIWLANGGRACKVGRKLALGGLARPMSLDQMSVTDNAAQSPTVAKMDSSQALQVSRMDDTPKQGSGLPTHAKPVIDRAYHGKTDGNGEMSDSDPDGFGSESGDKRHIGGTVAIKATGNWLFPGLGTLLGDTVADAIHPVMEEATRNSIMAGDKIGRETLGWAIGRDNAGFVGAMHTDPIGAVLSGKYFAEGGEVSDEPAKRADYRPGGEVAGPGTTTSDDVPAWLSDGEHVQNAVSTELVGVETLDAINAEGLAVRRGEKSPGAAQQAIGQILVRRADQLRGHGVKRRAVQLAGGGFLGGNMGIALGAGVDEWHRQKADQRADQQAAFQNEQMGWQRAEQADKKKQRDALAVMDQAYAESVLPGQTESGRSAAVAERLASAGHGVQAQAVREKGVAQRQQEALQALQQAAMTGREEDLGRVLEMQNLLPAPVGTRTVKTPEGKVAIEWFKRDDPTQTGMIGGRAFDNHYEAAAALHTMVTGKPLDYLKLSKLDENADQMRLLREQQNAVANQLRRDQMALQAEIAQARLDARGGGAGSSSSGGGKGPGMLESNTFYGAYGYKDPSEFTKDVHKRVGAEGAAGALGGNVDVNALAGRTQQHLAALMVGQMGRGFTTEELFPAALRMAQRDLGAGKADKDGKPAADDGAYRVYAAPNARGQWYARVRDEQGNVLDVGSREVDPGRYGIDAAARAKAEMAVPGLRGLADTARADLDRGDKAAYEQLRQQFGPARVDAWMTALKPAETPAAKPGAAAVRTPQLANYGVIKAGDLRRLEAAEKAGTLSEREAAQLAHYRKTKPASDAFWGQFRGQASADDSLAQP